MKFDRPTLFTFSVLIFILILGWAERNFTIGLDSIAPIAGITAIVFMSFDFISATRLRFLEKFAGGLDVLYRFHSYIGKLGSLVLIAHPLFLVITRFAGIETIQRFFLPGQSEFLNLGIYSFWLLLLLVILTVFIKMQYRWWKIIHMLMSAVYLFAAYHVFLDYTNAQRSPGITFKEGWILLIILLGLAALIYKQVIYPFLYKRYEVVEVRTIGMVTEVYMETAGKPIKFTPGQFVFMAVVNNPNLSKESHPFGITSSVNDSHIRVSIKHLGDWTNKAPLIKPGNKVKIWGPNGEFTWKNFDKHQKQIWIAGGIGIAPFLSMIRYSNETNSKKDIHLYYVEKNASECEYNKELSEIIKENGNIKLHHHYDQEKGWLTAKSVKDDVGDLRDYLILIVGPNKMMVNLKKQFMELGVPENMIDDEEFEMKP